MACCGAKPCKCPFRVWGPWQTKRVGRTSINLQRVGRTNQTETGWANQSNSNGLGEPIKPKRVGRTNQTQTGWANQYLKKMSCTPFAPLLHPVCTPPFCSILCVLICFVLDRLFTIVHDALPFCLSLHVFLYDLGLHPSCTPLAPLLHPFCTPFAPPLFARFLHDFLLDLGPTAQKKTGWAE